MKTIDTEILKFAKENINEDITRFKGEFWNIYNSKSSASWGWVEPLKFKGYKIVYLMGSPQHKGDKRPCYFDYISDKEFKEKE